MVWPIALLDWLLRWSDVVGILGSLLLSVVSMILTLALVYFYKEMRDVQQVQTEIQDKQTELIEIQTEISRANHEPQLRIKNVSFGKRDTIKLEIENAGNGIATNLKLACVIETENDYFDVLPSVTPLTEFGDSLSDQRRSLTPGSNAEFSAHVLVPMQSDEQFSNTRSWFSVATAKLNYAGTGSATIHVNIQYENILGDIRNKKVTSAPVWITSGKSIEKALTQYMDEIARDLPAKRGFSRLTIQHFTKRKSSSEADQVAVDFSTIDLWPMGYRLSLNIETPPEVGCEIKRGETVIETVGESSKETIQFGGDEHDYLDHGELIHVFAVRGESKWQIDMIGAGDHPPEGPPNARAIQRIMKLN